IDDPSLTMRFDWSPAGMHAIILSPQGTVLIFPYADANAKDYIVYYSSQDTKDVLARTCLVTQSDQQAGFERLRADAASPIRPNVVAGATLRTYRLAVAATAEFTQQYGAGNVAQTQAAISQHINLVNAIYRKE